MITAKPASLAVAVFWVRHLPPRHMRRSTRTYMVLLGLSHYTSGREFGDIALASVPTCIAKKGIPSSWTKGDARDKTLGKVVYAVLSSDQSYLQHGLPNLGVPQAGSDPNRHSCHHGGTSASNVCAVRVVVRN
jgi:hypothetical protein